MDAIKFWSKYDFQHATFSGNAGKVDVNYAKSRKFNSNTAAAPAGAATRVAAPTGGQVAAQASALAYHISLALNRGAIVSKLTFDIAHDLGLSIDMSDLVIGGRGILCGYTVTASKGVDPMGQRVYSYNHDVAIIGTGRNALEVYRQALSGPPTMSAGKKEHRPIANPLAIKQLGYVWVYRQAK